MNNETKDTRSGIKAYQESMRQETLRRIDDAYNYRIKPLIGLRLVEKVV